MLLRQQVQLHHRQDTKDVERSGRQPRLFVQCERLSRSSVHKAVSRSLPKQNVSQLRVGNLYIFLHSRPQNVWGEHKS